jgi:hypothetical protein
LRRRIQTFGRHQHPGGVHLFVEAHVGLEQFGIELVRLLGAPVRRIGLRRDDESHRLLSIQKGGVTTLWPRPSTGCTKPNDSCRAPWKTPEAVVELATLEWVSLFNHHCLLSSTGCGRQASEVAA